MKNPPSIDYQLALYAASSETTPIPCNVTLFVHGVVVTGQLCSWRLLHQEVMEEAETLLLHEENYINAKRTESQNRLPKDNLSSDGSDDVFLKDAIVYLPNGQTASFSWWQCRAYAIDAFALVDDPK